MSGGERRRMSRARESDEERDIYIYREGERKRVKDRRI